MTVPNAPLVAADLEGVFLPEIWIAVAERTGIQELRKTTRDIADYDTLMAYRMDILDRHGLTLDAIQAVIAEMEPLPGARALVDWIREEAEAGDGHIVLKVNSLSDPARSICPMMADHTSPSAGSALITLQLLGVPDV